MKDLSMLNSVKQALEQVVAMSDINNGTHGMELLCHYWQSESVYDEKRHKLHTELTRAVLASKLDDVKRLQEEIANAPKPKIIMEFKLMIPIPRIQGTRTIVDGDKTYKIHMENVQSLFIPEDAVNLGLLEYEETGDVMKDAQGRDAIVVKLHIKKGLIDVAAPKHDRNDKILVPKRAYVTAISYGAMQTSGRVLYNEQQARRRRYGFDAE